MMTDTEVVNIFRFEDYAKSGFKYANDTLRCHFADANVATDDSPENRRKLNHEIDKLMVEHHLPDSAKDFTFDLVEHYDYVCEVLKRKIFLMAIGRGTTYRIPMSTYREWLWTTVPDDVYTDKFTSIIDAYLKKDGTKEDTAQLYAEADKLIAEFFTENRFTVEDVTPKVSIRTIEDDAEDEAEGVQYL